MKKILLLAAVQFVFLFAFSASITQEEASRIVGERMSQETQPYTVYAKGEWQGQVVYFIKNSLKSCMFCDVYYEEGEKVIFEDDVYTFYTASKDWKLIYEFGKGCM